MTTYSLPLCNTICQWFSKMSRHQSQLDGELDQMWRHPQSLSLGWVWEKVWEFVFLTGSKVTLTFLIQALCVEHNCHMFICHRHCVVGFCYCFSISLTNLSSCMCWDSFLYFSKDLLSSLKGRVTETIASLCWSFVKWLPWPQWSVQSQESGPSSESPMWIQRPKDLGHALCCSPRHVSRNWIGS